MKSSKQRRNDRVDQAKKKAEERPDDRASAREMQYRFGVSNKALRKQSLCAKASAAVRHSRQFLSAQRKQAKVA